MFTNKPSSSPTMHVSQTNTVGWGVASNCDKLQEGVARIMSSAVEDNDEKDGVLKRPAGKLLAITRVHFLFARQILAVS